MTTLVLGSSGVEVGTAQQLLLEAGESIDQAELDKAFFGPSTKTALLDFQTSHLDGAGHPLVADGIIGDKTCAALENPRTPAGAFIADGWRGEVTEAPNADAMAAVSAAIGEIGVQEYPLGSNRGPRVDMYEGADWLGSPWCALFAGWVWGRAPGGSPFGVLASALKIRDWAASRGALLLPGDTLLPGDIGVILRAGGRGHVELVVGREFDGDLSLVGGNVSNAVHGTVRTRDAFTCFVRPKR